MTVWTEALEVASAHVDFVVDALTTARDTAQAALTTARADLAAAESARAAAAGDAADAWATVQTLTLERDGLAGQLTDAEADLARAQSALTATEAQVATLTVRVADLEADLAQSGSRTVWGACPAYPGGKSLAAAETVVNKWGPGAVVRQFFGALQAPHIPAGAAVVHASFSASSIPPAALLDGSMDAAITEWAQTLPGIVDAAGGTPLAVEWCHERDKKASDGVATRADLVAASNRWFDLLAAVLPPNRFGFGRGRIFVPVTYTGWLFDPASGLHSTLAEWGQIRGHVVGLDLDGIRPTALPYPDFSAEIARVQTWLVEHAARGYVGWAVPEFGAPRIAGDAGGLHRAAWVTDCGVRIAAAGALYVAAYEYDSTPGYALTTPAEISAYQALKA